MGEASGRLHEPFPAERFLPYLTSSDVAGLEKDAAAVILPIASIEQHGPHLPLVSDSLQCEELLARALVEIDSSTQLWVLPPLRYGKSTEHRRFPGTMTLSAATLAAVVREIAQSVASAGFRRLILANGHGGNPPVLDHVARDIREETGLIVFPLTVFRLGFDYETLGDQEDHWGTHAGTWETSLMLSLAPGLVHEDRMEGLSRYPRYGQDIEHLSLRGEVTYAWLAEDISNSGNMGDPAKASVAIGDRIRDAIVSKLAAVLREMAAFEMPKPGGADHV